MALPTMEPPEGADVTTAARRPAYRRIRVGELLPAVGAGLACAVPVTLLALAVRSADHAVIRADDRLLEAATGLTRRTPGLVDALLSWQWLTQPLGVNVACTVLCVWVWRRWGMRSRALWAFGTLMTVWGGQFLAKLVVQRARPVLDDTALAHAAGYSFPSGHAANTTGAVTVVLILTWPLLRRTAARVAAVTAGAAVVVATASDRVLLGVHYPSDVLAGILTGLGVVAASWLARPRSPVHGKAGPATTVSP